MSALPSRALQAAGGLAVVATAVVWLSGGCERRVAPGVAELPTAAAPAGTRPAPVEARVEEAREWASGAVAAARRTAISSRILARIEAVRVAAGSEVAAGDELVVLDARDLEARAREGAEALRGARARLDLARTEHQRALDLLRQGVGTQQRLDAAATALRGAEAEVQGLEQSLDEARTNLSFTRIRAPVAGRVVDRLAEPGDTAVPGRPLLRIYDPSLLRVEVPVRESLAVTLAVGQPLRVAIPSVDDVFAGTIDEIVPFAEPGARTLLVKVRLPGDDARLFAGMFARVEIPAGPRTSLRVPAAAVERIGQLEYVTVLDTPEGAVRRLVTTGGRDDQDGSVEVLSGLRAGEQVAVPRGAAEPPPASAG